MNSDAQAEVAERPIAVFDSGLGGLTVVRELLRVLPGEDIMYLGDTARVPYGNKSLTMVRRFSLEIASFLLRFSPKMLVVACNTASAAAVEDLEKRLPVPVVDVIRPGAAAALEASRGPIGVIATEATVASNAYVRAIQKGAPNRLVHQVPCPLLVPMIEEGWAQDDPVVLAVLGTYLRDLQRTLSRPTYDSSSPLSPPGALILGCTHYPLFQKAIGQVMGPAVAIISSAQAAAKEVQRRLSLQGGLSRRNYGGQLKCFTTDDEDRFSRLGERFGGRRIDRVQRVGTEVLEAALAELPPVASQGST